MNRLSGAAKRRISAFAVAATLVFSACESDPLFPESPVIASKVELFSAARANNLSQPAAFDFIGLLTFRLEVPGTAGEWDLVLSESGGQLVFLPSAAFPQFEQAARLTVVPNQTFAQVTTAPTDASLYTAEPRPVQIGTVYVIRLRVVGSCTRFAKFQVTEIDAAAGRVAIEFTRNPNCGGRKLVETELS